MSENISVRLEGGLGDCLLGNRFVAAIKDKYKGCEVTAYIDSEGKTFQKEGLDLLYPQMYKDVKVIQNKKYEKFWINCQFGVDNYKGALENVPDDVRTEMESYDKFYDLHIDSLKWTEMDFDWLRYHRYFPRPDLVADNVHGDYIVMHLISSTSVGHRLEQWYIDKLVTEVAKWHKLVLISTPETNHFYDNVKDLDNVIVFNGSIKDVCGVISNAKFMLSTDSGFRYIAYGYGIPTLTYSGQSQQAFTALPSHQMRWLVYPETCFPLDYDADHVNFMIHGIIKNPGQILAPYLNNYAIQAVKRDYTINKARTK